MLVSIVIPRSFIIFRLGTVPGNVVLVGDRQYAERYVVDGKQYQTPTATNCGGQCPRAGSPMQVAFDLNNPSNSVGNLPDSLDLIKLICSTALFTVVLPIIGIFMIASARRSWKKWVKSA